jgi:hypothetical protein
MPNAVKLGSINRFVAAILTLVWACAGVAGLIVAFTQGVWVAAVAGVFALLYAILWGRVATHARLLTWSDIVTPWRAR